MAKIKGYWKWHEDESTGVWISGDFRWNCSFESNGQTFTDIETYYNTGVQCIGYIGEGTNKSVRSFSSQGDEIVASWNTKYLVMNFGATWQDIDDELYSFITNHADSWGMSDRLITIYDNEQKVYDKGYQVGDAAGYDRGYAKGEQDGYSAGELKGYNDGKEDGKTEGRAEGKAEGLKEGYDNGYQDGLVSSEAYEKGKQAESDAFWEAFQANGTRTYYADAFRGSTVEYVRPKHKITPKDKGGASRIFYGCKFLKKAEAAYIDFSQIPRGSYISEGYYNTFTMCYELEEIEDIGFVPTVGYGSTFNVCKALRKIAVLRADVDTQFLNDTFGNCTALEEITFEGEIGSDINFRWSTKLTRASIENIINHLSDSVSGKTLTLSEAAVDKAFETEDLFGSETDEWATLYSSKPNWQITLV